MILTGAEIKKQVELGKLTIAPFDERYLNPNSYNYRLGGHYIVDSYEKYDLGSVDDNMLKIPSEGLLLQPGKLYLSSTYEVIGSEYYVTSLIGRSSVGRLGLFLQISADLGNLGQAHKWTLELTCVQPIKIYPEMIIGQVSFWKPEGLIDLKYRDNYSIYDYPQKSNSNKLFDASL